MDVNQKMTEMFGYSREEARRLSIEDISANVPPFTRLEAIDWLHKAAAGEPQIFEWLYRTREGKLFWGEANLKRAQIGGEDRVLGIVRDVTERKAAETALQKERDFITAVLETSAALVVVLDRSARIVGFNRACEKLTGYSFGQVRGIPFWDLFLIEEEMEPVKAVFDDLQAGRFPNEHENYWRTRDGTLRWIACSNTAMVGDDGIVEHIVCTGIDMTERRRASDALRQAHDELEQHVQDRTAELACANETLQAQREELRVQNEQIIGQADQLRETAAELNAVISAMAEGLTIYGLNEDHILMNPAAERMLGYTAAERHLPLAERIALLQLETADGKPFPIEEIPGRRALRGETVSGVVMALHPPRSDRTVWATNSAAPVRTPDGKLLGARDSWKPMEVGFGWRVRLAPAALSISRCPSRRHEERFAQLHSHPDSNASPCHTKARS